MTSRYSLLIGAVLALAPFYSASAAIISFTLEGTAGSGLLPGNENPARTGGTGGLGPGGITYNTDTNILSIDIAWGSANGFTDLTGDVVASHIHGYTDAPPLGWEQNRGVLVGLDARPGFDTSGTSGGFTGTIQFDEILDADLLAGLLAGQTYINVHTAENPGGEIRGQLQVVPIPAAVWLFGSGLLGLIGIARRKKA